MHRAQKQVQEFHRIVTGQPTSPDEVKFRNPKLRARLILEEAIETAIALVGLPEAQCVVQEQLLNVSTACTRSGKTEPSIVEAIDGLCDLNFVSYGTAEDLGVDLEPFWDEVCRSNLAKAGGGTDANGKLMKPKDWTPPDIEGVLGRYHGFEVLDDCDVMMVDE